MRLLNLISFTLFAALTVPLLGCAAETCVQFCEREHDDLVRIFGAPDDACEDERIIAAGDDCAACERAFDESLAIQAEVCEPER